MLQRKTLIYVATQIANVALQRVQCEMAQLAPWGIRRSLGPHRSLKTARSQSLHPYPEEIQCARGVRPLQGSPPVLGNAHGSTHRRAGPRVSGSARMRAGSPWRSLGPIWARRRGALLRPSSVLRSRMSRAPRRAARHALCGTRWRERAVPCARSARRRRQPTRACRD